MGCGTSRTVQVADEDAPDNLLKDAPDSNPPLISEATEELTSIHSNTPDRDSKPVEESGPPSTQVLHPNGTEPTSLPEPSAPSEVLPEAPEEPTLPHSAGGRAVAFEVDSPAEQGDSLIRKHPPRKFQKLEDQQSGVTLTQEKLEEKQATAEKRRQEILTQRVQSAKQRSARSAGRMRTRPSETDDVDQMEDGVIESAATDNPENEL